MPLSAYLYDAKGRDQSVELSADQLHAIKEDQLLWIDIEEKDPRALEEVQELLGLDSASINSLAHPNASRVENYRDYIQFSVVAAPATQIEEGRTTHRRNTRPERKDFLHFLIAERWIITVHCGQLKFIEDFRARDRAETTIGELSTYDFAASLLDVHLEAYFDEIARIEEMVDKLDEQALINPSGKTLLSRMVALRRRVSRLRSSLAAHRGVFYSLSRPDLQVTKDAGVAPHLQVLIGRYERALDEAEHTRDLVIGSFEIFASRTAQQTNELVQVLTYLTAVIGICAAVAGIFGMNFETSFFGSGDLGFYATIIILVLVTVASTALARWRGWI
jgi:Mg2+ and Co2+ transporter CorA